MNSEQQRLYFYEWGLARRYLVGRGIDPKQADAKRHDLHRKALGRDKSSKAFTNADLDKVIAVFRSVYDGGNLDAQLTQLDQPKKRAAAAISRIEVLMLHLQVEPGRESGYVQGIARKLFRDDQYQHFDDIRLAQLEGVIVRRLLQLHAKDRVDEILNDAATHAAKIERIVAGPGVDLPF